MAEAEAAAPWKARFRLRVVTAQDFIRDAHYSLMVTELLCASAVPTEFLAPGHADWTAVFRYKLVAASEQLTEAALNLSYAVDQMSRQPPEILELHGLEGDHVWVPLQEAAQEAALQDALGLLQVARVRAAMARDSTDWCAGHLSMQIALVDTPDIPNAMVDSLVFPFHTLSEARRRTQAAMDEVTSVLDVV